MAYDQGYYQQPQRPYNGRAVQRPIPAQDYSQGSGQQYSQDGYDEYGQDGYGYDEYNNGYGQDYNAGYQDMNGGGRGNMNGGSGYGNMGGGGGGGGRGGYGSPINGRGRGHPSDMNGGGRGYPPQNQNYPPQQDYHGNDRGGGMPPRGGGPGPNGRGMQRPPPDRGGFGGPQGRGGPPNGGPVNGPGRSMDGPVNSGPQQRSRKPLVTPPRSPEASWDSPFPSFPGAKKKTALSEEQEITKMMGGMDITSPSGSSGGPRTAGSKESQDRYPQRGMSTDDYGRPSLDSQRSMPRGYPPQGPPQGPPDQRRAPSRGPPQGPPRQDFGQRRGPPPGSGYGGGPRQNGYEDPGYDQGYGGGDFGPPQRSMTMPDNSNSMRMGNGGPLPPVSGPGPSAPYNGPIGRSMPVRPATATGSRPPPQRAYQNQPPAQLQQRYPPEDPYSAGGYDNHGANESISAFYDSYYESPPPGHNRTLSTTSEMPDFDNAAPPQTLHRRGTSIEAHIQPGAGAGAGAGTGTGSGPANRQSYERNGNLNQLKPAKSQPDFRAQAQPQTAIFEMAGDAPPIPDIPQQAYQGGWGQQNGQYDAQQQGPPQGQGYGAYDGQEQSFVPPPRSASAAPGAGRSFGNGPRPGFGGGLPNGPSPQNGGFQAPQNGGFQAPQNGGFQAPQNGGFQAPQNGGFQAPQNGGFQAPQNGGFQAPQNGGFQTPQNGGFQAPQNGGFQNQQNGAFQGGNQNSIPKQATPEGGLPPHAPPVRPGLIPNSFANQQQNIKPPPVRNYAGVNPGSQTSIPAQPMNSSSPGVPSPSPAASPQPPSQPVTQEELDRLRLKYKNGNPNDKETPLLFVKKLVEASEVLVAKLPDQRARNKAREKYVFEATKVLKKLREQQHPEAMFYFADCYGRGALGLEVNEKEAFTLYQSAAKLGHPGAAYRTAVCCELGNDEGGGTRKDPLKAIQWYTRAATLGDTPAMYKMGMIKLKGLLGQQQNPREAVVWLKRAAERADPENPHALHELGLLYEAPQAGDGALIHDEGYALQLFTQAAELGYKFSQFRLGQAYEYGLFGLAIDARQSIMWYSKAAVQDEHQSELALSGWYLTGHEGILQQSDTEAYLWARKAAMAKLAKAEYAMGYYCEEGIGTPKSLEDAKRWYWRAAAQNFPKAREKLEDLKRNGGRQTSKGRERISRSKGASTKNNEECLVM
ncbi:hypothetical protein ACMFMG_006581 [Clarireedia jacksonii]